MHVIVVAHGPARVTRAALARLRQTGELDSLAVVPAHHRAVGPGADLGGAILARGFGSAAVREHAETLPADDHVLVIHDDAAISRRGIRALDRALRATAEVAVPFSNESGSEQFIGPLPSATEVKGVLDKTPTPHAGRRIAGGRYSCFAARVDLLTDLGGSIVVPGSTLIRDVVRIELAEAVVAHDLSCNRRLVDPGDHAVLVASMIVKDEEGMIEGALASLQGAVDRIEICDTGSSDRTVEVARSMGANVREITWQNDFAWARNRALETCRDADFVLQLDADERLECDEPDLFRKWLHTWRQEIDGVRITLINDRGGNAPASRHSATRIAVAAEVEFHGALHETFVFSSPSPVILNHNGVSIHHLGYVPELVADRDKATRNIEISRAAYEDDQSVKSKIDYARSLLMADDGNALGRRLFHEVHAEIGPGAPRMAKSYVTAMVARYAVEDGDLDRALDLAFEALALTSNEDLALATIGQVMVGQGRFAELVESHRKLAGRPPGNPMFQSAVNLACYEAHVARAILETGDPAEALELMVGAMERDAGSVVHVAAEAIAGFLTAGGDPHAAIPLLARDPYGVIVQAVVGLVPPAVTAELCREAVRSGARERELLKIGLMAGIIKGLPDTVDTMLPHAAHMESIAAVGVMGAALRRGQEEVAERVRHNLLSTVGV